MQSRNPKGIIILLITALIWGCAFAAQSVAADFVGPFTFQSIRSFLGFLVLLPVIAAMNAARRKRIMTVGPAGTDAPGAGIAGNAHTGNEDLAARSKDRRTLFAGGFCCGLFLTIASILQQYGITLGVSAGKAGFITAFYLLLVPVFGFLFLKRKTRPVIWLCVAIALAGLYFLCAAGETGLAPRDLLVVLCAVFFSFQILTIDHFVQLTDGVKMACIQFLTSGILSGIFMLLLERPALTDILAAWKPLLYAGILSSGVAYTFQIIGQKYTEPTIASMLMSLESVFAVLAGIVILHQLPSPREWFGCALMFAAVVLSQMPACRKTPSPEPGA